MKVLTPHNGPYVASSIAHRLRHRYLFPVVSRTVPERVLRFMDRHWRVGYDPSDGWTFWLDASYDRWCRRDRKRTAALGSKTDPDPAP